MYLKCILWGVCYFGHSNPVGHATLCQHWDNYPAGNYMFKADNRNTRISCEICSKLTIKKTEWHQWCCSGAFIVNLTCFTPCTSVSIVNIKLINAGWVESCSFSVEKMLQSHKSLLLIMTFSFLSFWPYSGWWALCFLIFAVFPL